MPRGQGPTPIRSIRVPDPLWAEAKRACEVMGTTVNAEIVRFLERLVRDHPLPPDQE